MSLTWTSERRAGMGASVSALDALIMFSGLLQCLTAVRAVRAREQLTETELKLNEIAEIGIVVDYIAVNMVAGNEQIPAK